MPVQEEFQLLDRTQIPDGRPISVTAREIRPARTPVSDEFVANIRLVGVREPVLLFPSPATFGVPYRIVDGHRRIAAMRIIDAERPFPAILYPTGMTMRQVASIALSTNLHRTPNAEREYDAINELMDTGATVPQIASALGIPEATIIARLRVGNLNGDLRSLLSEGRLSTSLAQRLGAESLQTQQRIWREFVARENEPGRGSNHRLTTRDAYPERPSDEQIRLLPTMPTIDVFSALTEPQRVEIYQALLRTMQPENIDTFMAELPTQTKRELYRKIFQSVEASEEWTDLAETTFTQRLVARFASSKINETVTGFVGAIHRDAAGRLRELFSHELGERVNVLTMERDVLRASESRALQEIERQRERYRQLERLSAVRAVDEASAPFRPPLIPVETEGRGYRETLQGPSDDPAENAEAIRITMLGETRVTPDNAEAIAAAQYDYPVAEESWELVVEHLTDAADAMPLTPSDECDRFHHDIEGLRVRAIQMERAENANAGVTVGRVIPPPPPAVPEPSRANSGNVRRVAGRGYPDGVVRVPSSLEEHAALLAEQAEQINANTTRRRGSGSGSETAAQRRARLEAELGPRIQRPVGSRLTPQQEAIASSRRGGHADALRTAAREALERGDSVVHINPDGTVQRVEPAPDAVAPRPATLAEAAEATRAAMEDLNSAIVRRPRRPRI